MNRSLTRLGGRSRTILLSALMLAPMLAGAATTNWIAYNDHRRGTGTAPNVSTWSPDNVVVTLGGPLTNFTTGDTLPVGVSIAVVGSTLDGDDGSCTAPNAGTPASLAFEGKVDYTSSAFYFCNSPYTASFTITFTNLDATKKYTFREVPQRGNSGYATRWGTYMLVGAASGTAAHEQGPGSLGVITNGWSPYGDLMAPGTQVAINCGNNLSGDMIVWTDVVPDGTSFSVVCSNWLAATPGGAANSTYCYAINAFSLEEVEAVTTPITIVQQPVGTNVLEFRPFTLRVQATGSAPQYQWFKVGTGLIPGANKSTYTVAQAQLSDTGDYYVIVSNSANSEQSVTVHVEVIDDTGAPTILSAVGSANLQEITLQFSEKMDTNVIFDNFAYDLSPPGSAIQSGRWTNEETVLVLTTDIPYQPGTAYTLTVQPDLADLAGNVINPRIAQFQSWVANPFGGVVFQVFNNLSTTDNNIGVLTTNDARFPQYPDATYLLSSNNTFEVFPTDTTLREGFGGRMRSLFIPLISGQYRFFTRSDDSSQIWLNPAGPDPAGAILVAQERGCCNAFQEPPALQTSEPFDMIAGRGYYLEAVYKEGTGGDFCQVAARPEGSTVPAALLDPLGASYSAYQNVPAGLVGVPTFPVPPANTIVAQPGTATFTVTAAATPAGPFVYQWQRSDDGGATFTNLSSATGDRFTTPPTSVSADNGAKFRVIAYSHGGTATSDPVTLTVLNDTTNPKLLSAVGSTNMSVILLTFSEDLDPNAASDDFGAYVVTNLDTGASLGDVAATVLSPTTVELTTTVPRVFGNNYQVTVNPVDPTVTDLVGLPVVAPDNQALVASTGAVLPFVSPWSYNGDGAPGQAPEWVAPGFNDIAWPVSNAMFAAKSGTPDAGAVPLNALIPRTGTAGTNVTTYYFRSHFALSAYPSNVSEMMLYIVADDGAVIYLNGQELYRIRMNASPPAVTYDTWANTTESTVPIPTYGPFAVPTTNLVFGDNVVAVEVHQVNATSSDMYFALELTAAVTKFEPPSPEVAYAYDPVTKSLTLSWVRTDYELWSAPTPIGPWTLVSPQTNPYTVSAGGPPPATFFQLKQK